jgi:hypothetical protein
MYGILRNNNDPSRIPRNPQGIFKRAMGFLIIVKDYSRDLLDS